MVLYSFKKYVSKVQWDGWVGQSHLLKPDDDYIPGAKMMKKRADSCKLSSKLYTRTPLPEHRKERTNHATASAEPSSVSSTKHHSPWSETGSVVKNTCCCFQHPHERPTVTWNSSSRRSTAICRCLHSHSIPEHIKIDLKKTVLVHCCGEGGYCFSNQGFLVS